MRLTSRGREPPEKRLEPDSPIAIRSRMRFIYSGKTIQIFRPCGWKKSLESKVADSTNPTLYTIQDP
jgi:hypothetical protein